MSPTPIRIGETSQVLSARGGMVVFREVVDQLGLKKTLGPCLPVYKIATRASSYDKFEALMLGLVAGADCLDEMERLQTDQGFVAVCDELVSARTYGDYLRLFDASMLRKLNDKLIETALRLRIALGKLGDSFTLKLDSTDHEQHGKKGEGFAENYKGNWGLDSLLAFDELGFQYWHHVREGSTYTSNGAPEVIDAVMRKLPRRVRRKFVLADSGFCNNAFFLACANAQAKFCCAMRSLMFNPLIKRVGDHWKKTKDLLFYDKRDCEIGSCVYRPKKARETLRVVFLRALKDEEQRKGLFGDERYDYVAFVTNMGEHEMKSEDVVLWYRKRSDVENHIKELKGSFDLKHFPCQKLNANRAYGLIAAFAQNLVRYAAYVENPASPNYAKLLRFKMLALPVQVVRHARSVIFRFMTHHRKEIERWLKTIKTQFGFVDAESLAAPPAVGSRGSALACATFLPPARRTQLANLPHYALDLDSPPPSLTA